MTGSPGAFVRVQHDDFSAAELQAALLAGDAREGAVATFTGYVRRDNAGRDVQTLTLEHYPGMTEASIAAIIDEAAGRWPVLAAGVVHRIGELHVGEQIVWVGVSSAHRQAAFEACEFIMDYLKTRAPFWKKEVGAAGSAWVDARETDERRAARWDSGGQGGEGKEAKG